MKKENQKNSKIYLHFYKNSDIITTLKTHIVLAEQTGA